MSGKPCELGCTCGRHRWYGGPSRTPPEYRFWEKVAVRGPDECWPWTKSTIGGGYGGFWVQTDVRLEQYAHRAAFFLTRGYWPEPACLHTCDNPPCCNPAHLREGDQADNAEDRAARGRGTGRVALLASSVLEIRDLRGRLSQAEVAHRYGISQAYVSAIQLCQTRMTV